MHPSLFYSILCKNIQFNDYKIFHLYRKLRHKILAIETTSSKQKSGDPDSIQALFALENIICCLYLGFQEINERLKDLF